MIETKQLNNCDTQVVPIVNDSYNEDRQSIFKNEFTRFIYVFMFYGYFYL